MSEFNYIQMPPDGTGKKSKQTVETIIGFISGTIAFELGDNITTDDGFEGNVILIDGTTEQGRIHVRVRHDSNSADVPTGTALKVDGVTNATSTGESEILYNQDIVITGGNNPINKVSVTAQGAMFVQYPTGTNQFDAFGKLMTSESTTIREYQPVYDIMPGEFTDTTTGTASITWNQDRHLIEMAIGDQAGDKVTRRSNLYHKYQTGVATTVMMTVFRDGTRENVQSRVGLFDDLDGLYFELNHDEPAVIVRSSVSGSVVETKVPRSEWNVDRLDGSGSAHNISRVSLNPTNIQILFIDFQWLGGGRVRFGFVVDGEYIVCHEMNHANEISNPYMRTGTLPLSYEIENIGVPNPQGTSTFFSVSAAVKAEGKFKPKEYLAGGPLPPAIDIFANDGSMYHSLGSVKPAKYISLGPKYNVPVSDFVIETGYPSTITSDTVDFSTYVETDSTIRIIGPSLNYERNAYKVGSVTSGSPSTITLNVDRGILNRDSFSGNLLVGQQWENGPATILTEISVTDISDNPKPFLFELAKNATKVGPVDGVSTTESLVGGTNYVLNEIYETTGGTGTGCKVQCEVTGGVVTAVYINRCGTGYTIGDTLTIDGGDVNATFDVLTLEDQDCFYVDSFPGNSLVAARRDSNYLGVETDGNIVYSNIMQGTKNIDLTSIFGYNNELIIRKANIDIYPDEYTFRVKTLDPTHAPKMMITLTWKEIR